MDKFFEVLNAVDAFVWGPFFLIPLLLGTGLWLTICLTGIQFRKLGPALHLALLKRDEGAGESVEGTQPLDDTIEGDISHYQALTTALAATVGVGNIAGVATAIHIGGPGAVFWMWVTGLVGMASKYSEAFLAVRFRTKDAKGEMSGGPQYYLEHVTKVKWLGRALAIAFAIFAIIASFGIGNLTQANSVATQLEASFGVNPWMTGLFMAALTGIVLLGGVKSIGRVTSAFVPIMIILYVGASLIVLGLYATKIPGALALIFHDAFTGTAATGGFVGSTFMLVLQYGVARGIFSNESGMGSAAIAAAAARTREPVRQGLVSMTQTFIDTIIVVSMTALVIVVTGAWTVTDADGQTLDGSPLTAQAFNIGFPGGQGHFVVAVSLVFFAFSTVLGWAYYGERCVQRLFGLKAVTVYRLLFAIVVFVGCITELKVAWTLADVTNGLMALPNLIGLILASGLIARETRAYLKRDPKLQESQ
ncbi:sodium:alanine symporter family protein [uncultured Mobiluncus sp.]|uniref:alanine/glycine:cation symporter family protein n=1 Tax=uncultured Mobiluncus sp. TaxID=293425 RepID=UPI0025E38049|nr:sodium:alanine symporter family protein [uncultured Mobiluncus sp.]